MRQLACEVPVVSFLSLLEVGDGPWSARLAFVPLAGSLAQETVSLVHRASGPLEAAVSIVVHHLSSAFETLPEV